MYICVILQVYETSSQKVFPQTVGDALQSLNSLTEEISRLKKLSKQLVNITSSENWPSKFFFKWQDWGGMHSISIYICSESYIFKHEYSN